MKISELSPGLSPQGVIPRWQGRIGHQRSLLWRGLQLRYSFWRSPAHDVTPILLLHGFGAAIEHWRGLIPILARERPVYVLDLLGFGGSRKAALSFGVDLWGEQVHDFLETVVGKPAILMGNSIGSLVAAVVAQRYPHSVAAIALLSVPDVARRQVAIPKPLRPVVVSLEQLTLRPWLIRRIFYFLRRRSTLKNWLKLAYPSCTEIPDELVDIIQPPTHDQGAAEAFIALSRRVSQPDFCPPMEDVFPQIQCPILMLWGEKDRFVPVAIAPELATLNPQITYRPLPNLGHCPHDEDPNQVYQNFVTWLGETDVL